MTVVQVDDLMLSDESGFACSKTKLVDEGLPHLRPFNITDDGRLEVGQVYQVPAVEAPPSKRELLPGDVLFNNTNSVKLVGKATIIREPIVAGFSNHLTRIRVDAKRVEPEYFAFWLRRLRSTGFFTSQATQWVSQAAFRTAELRRLEIDLPGLDEQRRIVDLLARAEGIVRLRREAQHKAAELIPAIFINMFGDPATNPRDWPVHTLGSLADIQGGLQVTRARAALPLQRPYLRVANVHRGRLDLNEMKSIRLTEAEFRRTALHAGDLLVVEGHGNPQEVGRVAAWDDNIPDCTHQNHLIRARPARDRLLPEYACALLNSEAGRQTLLRAGKTTSGLSTISAQNVKNARVMLPPVSNQASFVRHADAVASLIRQQTEALDRAASTLASLLAEVFSVREVQPTG